MIAVLHYPDITVIRRIYRLSIYIIYTDTFVVTLASAMFTMRSQMQISVITDHLHRYPTIRYTGKDDGSSEVINLADHLKKYVNVN